MHSEIAKVAVAAQAVYVEMINGHSSGVFLDEYKSGAGDDAAVGDAKAQGYGPRQMRLAGAERADQGDDGARKKQSGQPSAERLGRRQVGQVNRHRRFPAAVVRRGRRPRCA